MNLIKKEGSIIIIVEYIIYGTWCERLSRYSIDYVKSYSPRLLRLMGSGRCE